MADIKFPFTGCFTAKRSGYTWTYTVHADGSVDGMRRTVEVSNSYRQGRYKVLCGGYRQKEIYVRETKECLQAIERVTGRKTDGWKWID